MDGPAAFHRRWLGTVGYREADVLQRSLHAHTGSDYALLLEHPHTYTFGRRGDLGNVLVDHDALDAELITTDRGGDVTYHGPGQLVGYPILTLDRLAGVAGPRDYVASLERVIIAALQRCGLDDVGTVDGCPGVWVAPHDAPRKVAAIGIRVEQGRTRHGFAINVNPDLERFTRIVPCGIAGKPTTSMAADGVDVPMGAVVDVVSELLAEEFAGGSTDHAGVTSPRRGDADLAPFSTGAGAGETVRYHSRDTTPRRAARLAEAGVTRAVSITERKPDWMRAKVTHSPEVARMRREIRSLDLVTVCEEAGCPNLSECWSEGTATFMVAGDRCTRACGFCLVDTRRPAPLDADEPRRVAEAVARSGLSFAVLTMVARDDLTDGAAAHVASCIDAIHERCPGVEVEALISDLRGDGAALDTVFAARPEILNHNIETVARLQRAARPSAGYARSLAVLAAARDAGLRTKSGIVAGLGETDDEVRQTLADLAAVGVEIVTIGQYLRPTTNHLPVAEWWPPGQFDEWKRVGEEELGFAHVESSPFTRSSYHAQRAASAAGAAARGAENGGRPTGSDATMALPDRGVG